MNKDEILESIHQLVSHNVIGGKQLFQRYKGFRAELELEEYLKSNFNTLKLLNGGLIISLDSRISSLNNSIYVTVVEKSKLELEEYIRIFTLLKVLDYVEMYLVVYDSSVESVKEVMKFSEGSVSLKLPSLEIYNFNKLENLFEVNPKGVNAIKSHFKILKIRGKNIFHIEDSHLRWLKKELNHFTENSLTNIYMERLILDGLIGFSVEKGKMSDIDLIVKRPDGEIRLIEIKEKDLPKRAKKGFGIDVPRLEDMMRVENFSGLQYHLVVKHIDNQTDRNLKEWLTIRIKDFEANVNGNDVIEGGTGMRSTNSSNPTLICDYSEFKKL